MTKNWNFFNPSDSNIKVLNFRTTFFIMISNFLEAKLELVFSLSKKINFFFKSANFDPIRAHKLIN